LKYKVVALDEQTNKEDWEVEEIFNSEKDADEAIQALKTSFSKDYRYIKKLVTE
jgi:hypothetical protein